MDFKDLNKYLLQQEMIVELCRDEVNLGSCCGWSRYEVNCAKSTQWSNIVTKKWIGERIKFLMCENENIEKLNLGCGFKEETKKMLQKKIKVVEISIRSSLYGSNAYSCYYIDDARYLEDEGKHYLESIVRNHFYCELLKNEHASFSPVRIRMYVEKD